MLKQNDIIVASILVHVDDILLARTNTSIHKVEKLLLEKFQLTNNE